jgi:hypothetical protein
MSGKMEACVTSHRLRCGPFPPRDVNSTAQNVREGEDRTDGYNGEISLHLAYCPWNHGLRPKELWDSEAVPPAPVVPIPGL